MILLDAHPTMVAPAVRRDTATLWLLLGAAALLLVRCPPIWLTPRLWAEEGAIYLTAALENGFWGSLFQLHLGYYSLLDNVVIGIASLFPLQYAAHFTVYTAALVALAPIAVVLALPSQWWPDLRSQCVVVLALLLLAGEETYLNLINGQFYLAAACVLLLVVDIERTSRRQRAAMVLLLVVSALSSPQTCFLLPAFWLRVMLGHEPALRRLTMIFSIAVLVQAGCVISALQQGEPQVARGLPAVFSLPAFFKTLAQDIWLNAYFRGLRDHWQARALQNIAGYLLLVCSALILWRARRAVYARVLAVALLLLAVLSMLASIDMAGGQRYAYASSVLLLLIALSAVRQAGNGVVKFTVGGLLLLALFSQASMYPMLSERYFDPAWPSWRSALHDWQRGGTPREDGVVIWPVSAGWRTPLPIDIDHDPVSPPRGAH